MDELPRHFQVRFVSIYVTVSFITCVTFFHQIIMLNNVMTVLFYSICR
jgi:hypothetical protein